MATLSFNRRFGFDETRPVDRDFPITGRIALAYLIDKLARDWAFGSNGQEKVLTEALRTARTLATELELKPADKPLVSLLAVLKSMQWWQVFVFCERLHSHYFEDYGYHEDEDTWVVTTTKETWQSAFSSQLNEILSEENIAFQFVDGQFQRQGRAHTQKMAQKVGVVLADPKLQSARQHFNKAKKYFEAFPDPDFENSIKEAICSLEACLEVLTEKPASKDFASVVKNIRGNGPRQIPPPIAESMIRVSGYRGSGQGVAHAALGGNRVEPVDVELVLNLVASYITYLYDLLMVEEEIPF